MPFVQCHTNAVLNPQQKQQLRTECTGLITILPGKKINSTMVEIADGLDMYFDDNADPCMKIRVELYKETPYEFRSRYAEEIMKAVERITEIPVSRIYLTFLTYDHWGRDGILKQ